MSLILLLINIFLIFYVYKKKKINLLIICIALFILLLSFLVSPHGKANEKQTYDPEYIIIQATELIKKFESEKGYKMHKYKDSNKKYIICYGNSYAEYYKRFKTKKGIRLNCDLMVAEKVESLLNNMRDDNIPLETNEQYIALISLAYNLKNNYEYIKETNLYEHLWHEQNLNGIIVEWLDFNIVNNKTMCGLVNRRAKELKVFYNNDKEINKKIEKYKNKIKCHKSY